MGDPVRLVSLEEAHGVLREAGLIGFVAVALRLGQRRMTEHRHDHLRGGAGLSEHSARRLPQSVRLCVSGNPASVIASRIHCEKPSTVNGRPHAVVMMTTCCISKASRAAMVSR